MCLVTLKLDVKKERRNNLIPAKIGFYTIFNVFLVGFIDGVAYGITELNLEERVLWVAVTNDTNIAIIAPATVLYGMPSVSRSIRNKISFERFYIWLRKKKANNRIQELRTV